MSRRYNLMPGERAVYETRPHPIIFVLPGSIGAFFIFGTLGAAEFPSLKGTADAVALGLALVLTYGLIAMLCLLPATLKYISTCYLVTNRRVIVKKGWLFKQTDEVLLSKVESISVQQSPMGQSMGYGTVVISGTGGTKNAFRTVVNPLEFRETVQRLTEQVQQGYYAAPTVVGPTYLSDTTPTKKCPDCAERVLFEARKCRFCGFIFQAPASKL